MSAIEFMTSVDIDGYYLKCLSKKHLTNFLNIIYNVFIQHFKTKFINFVIFEAT